MDISDGLSSDLMHICKQSNVGCVLYEDKLPLQDEAKEFAYKLQLDPTACALSGGEDYELLFTVSQGDYEKIKTNSAISIIGYITDAAYKYYWIYYRCSRGQTFNYPCRK